MCRNIRTLFNFDPPVTDEEIRAAALQFVRKVSGFNRPSKANEGAFLAAVDQVPAADLPAVIGQLEVAKARALTRLTTPAPAGSCDCPAPSRRTANRWRCR